MIEITELRLPPDYGEAELMRCAARRLGIPAGQIAEVRLRRRAVDARRKNDVHFIATVAVRVRGDEAAVLRRCRASGVTAAPREPAHPPAPAPSLPKLSRRPVVVGFGPAGIFAALALSEAGLCPIVLERGKDADERARDVALFWERGVLDPESNVQFGEGGAGTFSDGKLTSGIGDARCRTVLETFVRAGAPEEILWQAKPHIGTDRLGGVVKALRARVAALGGEVRFRTRAAELLSRDGRIAGVRTVSPDGENELGTDAVILAVGHSARDTFAMLWERGVPMEQKPFAVGARIEHAQAWLDRRQYGDFARFPALGAADYKLSVHLPDGRGVYTFCMCPGGVVVAAASEPGRLVTNGMSRFARDGENANSALLVGVGPGDFGSGHPLAGVEFQRRLEESAFRLGGGTYAAPAQRVEDFLSGRVSARFGGVLPSYRPGTVFAPLDGCLPPFVAESLRLGLPLLDRKLPGFAYPDALLTGVETRSSSPVRILRGPGCESPVLRGLYPCGEGAGYAGGILSAAVDGMRCAEMLIRSVREGS